MPKPRKWTANRHWVCVWLVAGALTLPVSAQPSGQTSSFGIAESSSLVRAVEVAQSQAPEVLVANAELYTSRAAMVGASLPPLGNPYVEVAAGRGDHGATRDLEVKSSLMLPIEVAGQRSSRIAEADAWFALHAVGLEQARAMAGGAAVRAWGTAVCEQVRLHALEELTESAATELRLLEARRAAGDATEQDVKLAAAEYGRNRSLLEEARANLTRALSELELTTGVKWDRLPSDAVRAPTQRILLQRTKPDVTRLPNVRRLRAEAEFHDRTLSRYGRESWTPLNLTLSGGRGDLGEARLGVGVGMSLPVIRRFQGERARAQGDRDRAAKQSEVAARVASLRLEAAQRELSETRQALDAVEGDALPAAAAAVMATAELRRAGKADFLAVLIARREVTNLTLRRVDLALREWMLLASWVDWTGKLP